MPPSKSRRPVDANVSLTQAARALQEAVDVLSAIRANVMTPDQVEPVRRALAAAGESHREVLAAIKAEVDNLTVGRPSSGG